MSKSGDDKKKGPGGEISVIQVVPDHLSHLIPLKNHPFHSPTSAPSHSKHRMKEKRTQEPSLEETENLGSNVKEQDKKKKQCPSVSPLRTSDT